MRQLHPVAFDEVDPADIYARPRRTTSPERRGTPDRPWVMVNMVTSLDGATAIDGLSGGLGGPDDRRVFAAIRAVADVIVAAAGTVRAENYGPPTVTETIRAARRARGQTDQPRLAVVTNRLDLDPNARLFAGSDGPRPLLLTSETAPADARARLESAADILVVGSERVDLTAALAALVASGAQIVLVEGGPSLNGQFVADDLVDELCLSLSPLLAAGESARIAHGPVPTHPTLLKLDHILAGDDGTLFLRYSR